MKIEIQKRRKSSKKWKENIEGILCNAIIKAEFAYDRITLQRESSPKNKWSQN